MDSQKYCYQKAMVVGSAFYYAIKKLKPSQRDIIIAIQAFYLEIEQVIFHFTDLGVAQARLNWWREEIIKAAQKNATHPVLQCLQQYPINLEKLLTIIDGLEQNLAFLSFASYDEVVVHFMRTAGERELLFAEVVQPEGYDKEQIYHVMLVLELVHYIQHFRKYAERDLIYFSDDELKKFHLERSDFNNVVTTRAMRNLLQSQVEKIELAYQKIYKQNLNTFLRIRLQIALATIKEIAGDFLVLENFVDLTPLRKWWIACKCGAI
jgi:phytoene synthase